MSFTLVDSISRKDHNLHDLRITYSNGLWYAHLFPADSVRNHVTVVATLHAIRGQPPYEYNGEVIPPIETSAEFQQEVRARGSATFEAGKGRTDVENSPAIRERGFVRHVLDEGYLRQYVWEATLRPFGDESDLLFVTGDELPTWLKSVSPLAASCEAPNGLPDAVVGMRLSDAQRKAIDKLKINVGFDIEDDSVSITPDPDADLDSAFLPLMVCMTRANLITENEKREHPPPYKLVDQACLRAYPAAIGLRKIRKAFAGQDLPAPPPLLVAMFSDSQVTVWGLRDVDEKDLGDEPGLPYRYDSLVNHIMDRGFATVPGSCYMMLKVWQVRQAAAQQLRAYLDAVARL